MDIANKCKRISNSYYNLGLEKAKNRNFSGAIICLKKSLQFNKNQIDARNLLGLIYFELGEIAEALVEWVISLNLSGDFNMAQKYIDILQRKTGRIEVYEQSILKYNQGLIYAQNDNEDLAILQLTKATEMNPKYVRAYLLLAALYMKKEDYTKANKALLSVLQIDRNNSKALLYMNLVKENSKKPGAEKNKLKDTLSHKKMQDDDVIIPTGYKEYSWWHTIVNIGIGLLIGGASIIFLYMPTNSARLNSKHNSDIIAISEKLNNANIKINELKELNAGLNSKNMDLNEQADTSIDNKNHQLEQYALLIGTLEAYKSADMNKAAAYYADIDADTLSSIDSEGSLTNVSVMDIYKSISSDMKETAPAILTQSGDFKFETGDFSAAIVCYDKALKINEAYIMALYKKALSYKKMGEVQKANSLFESIIVNHPNTQEAELAKQDRGY